MRRRLGLALPAAGLVGDPVGHLERALLRLTPALARGGERFGVLAVEHQDDALIPGGIRRYRSAINEEPDLGGIAVVAAQREQHRLHCGVTLAVGTMC